MGHEIPTHFHSTLPIVHSLIKTPPRCKIPSRTWHFYSHPLPFSFADTLYFVCLHPSTIPLATLPVALAHLHATQRNPPVVSLFFSASMCAGMFRKGVLWLGVRLGVGVRPNVDGRHGAVDAAAAAGGESVGGEWWRGRGRGRCMRTWHGGKSRYFLCVEAALNSAQLFGPGGEIVHAGALVAEGAEFGREGTFLGGLVWVLRCCWQWW